MADERRRRRRPRAPPQRADTARFDLGRMSGFRKYRGIGGRGGGGPERTYPTPEKAPSLLALCLQRRLERVDRGEDHPEQRGGHRRKHRLEQRRQRFEHTVGLEEREDARVRGGVAKAVRK
jgi:hypothetical protein